MVADNTRFPWRVLEKMNTLQLENSVKFLTKVRILHCFQAIMCSFILFCYFEKNFTGETDFETGLNR